MACNSQRISRLRSGRHWQRVGHPTDTIVGKMTAITDAAGVFEADLGGVQLEGVVRLGGFQRGRPRPICTYLVQRSGWRFSFCPFRAGWIRPGSFDLAGGSGKV